MSRQHNCRNNQFFEFFHLIIKTDSLDLIKMMMNLFIDIKVKVIKSFTIISKISWLLPSLYHRSFRSKLKLFLPFILSLSCLEKVLPSLSSKSLSTSYKILPHFMMIFHKFTRIIYALINTPSKIQSE